MAGAQAKTIHSRSTWRGRDPDIRRSGVAERRPAAGLIGYDATQLPGRLLKAHELIQMAQAARRPTPHDAEGRMFPGAGQE